MIRVVYTWEVTEGHRQEFLDEWRRLTERIRTEFEGSYGSTLLESTNRPGRLVGIARWASPEHLASFRHRAGPIHVPYVVLTSLEVLTELTHLTVENAAIDADPQAG